MGDFHDPCPWCGLCVDAGFSKPTAVRGRRCPCGAVAFAELGSGRRAAIAAMIEYYGIMPSPALYDIYGDDGWLKGFHIEIRKDPAWLWYKRSLPWEPPAGPMTDEERLAWLKSQGEKFYDLMYNSPSPRSEYRESKEAFEDAIILAEKLGRKDEAGQLAERLAHIKAVFRSQFDL